MVKEGGAIIYDSGFLKQLFQMPTIDEYVFEEFQVSRGSSKVLVPKELCSTMPMRRILNSMVYFQSFRVLLHVSSN